MHLKVFLPLLMVLICLFSPIKAEILEPIAEKYYMFSEERGDTWRDRLYIPLFGCPRPATVFAPYQPGAEKISMAPAQG
ncbi:unnamed protein product [Caenorhabditis auriculariae]|uniref:Uncharacterized protein n=1 Tax=Caenorhabditis auriculariae TaxID=2777116 RepID=A0A8S1GSS0_9PELO|nr:unnamed protein product [Caenorhabditis auriculariae]